MGFAVSRLGIVIPKPILFALCLLGFIQYLISCLFMCLGLSNIIEPDVGWSDSSVQQPKRKALAALLIKEKLPVVRFEELAVDEKHNGCVVCLEEIQGQEEIRRLVFCRHVFHRECLDRWIDHDQKACPLCRTPLAGKMMRLLWLSRRWGLRRSRYWIVLSASFFFFFKDNFKMSDPHDIPLQWIWIWMGLDGVWSASYFDTDGTMELGCTKIQQTQLS